MLVLLRVALLLVLLLRILLLVRLLRVLPVTLISGLLRVLLIALLRILLVGLLLVLWIALCIGVSRLSRVELLVDVFCLTESGKSAYAKHHRRYRSCKFHYFNNVPYKHIWIWAVEYIEKRGNKACNTAEGEHGDKYCKHDRGYV